MTMDMNLVSVAVLQILAVGAIAGALLLYLLRFRRTPRLDVGHKSVFITNCESVIGYECAKRMDRLGLRVFAGVSNLSSEKADTLKKEASDKLHLVEFDVGNCEKIDKAVEYVHQHLPTDEEGVIAPMIADVYNYDNQLTSSIWVTNLLTEEQVYLNTPTIHKVATGFIEGRTYVHSITKSIKLLLKHEYTDLTHTCSGINDGAPFLVLYFQGSPRFRGLWALINTTSECIGGLLERMTWEQCERQVHINLVGAIRLTKAFLPMLKRRKGRLVSLVCLGGQPCYPGFSVYASCKAGIESFFEALKYEMHRYGITFITVSPTIQYQFETRVSDTKSAGCSSATGTTESKFGDKPKVCVLDIATRDAALADLEDAVTSANPLAQYTSFPVQNKLKTVVYSYLPQTWKKHKVARDFQYNFMSENQV